MRPNEVVLAILGAALLALVAWAWAAGPCEAYKFNAAADVPARCLMEGDK